MIRWLRRNLRRPMSNAASADYVRAHRFCVARVEFVDGNELIDILYGAGWAGYWPNTRLFLGEHGMREVRRDQVYRITCIHPWANAPAHIDNEVLSSGPRPLWPSEREAVQAMRVCRECYRARNRRNKQQRRRRS